MSLVMLDTSDFNYEPMPHLYLYLLTCVNIFIHIYTHISSDHL